MTGSITQKRRGGLIALGILVLGAAVAGGTWYFVWRQPPPINDPELTTPVLAVRAISPHSLFFTPAARAALAALRPDLLTPADRDDQSERARQFSGALQDPGLWRRLDRQARFDTVLLSGEPNLFRPLLKHLLESGDWTLTYLDHTSIVFQIAPGRKWEERELEPLRAKFSARSAREQLEFLVQASNRLLSAGHVTLAKTYADAALELDKSSAPAWTQLAACDGKTGKWPDALTAADEALRRDDAFQPAMAMKAQALLAMNKASDAYAISQKLAELNPRDPFLLFQHARIAHAAHAYESETDALKNLISMAEAAHQPTCGYHIYLAQAYASRSEAEPAVTEFQKALDDPAISPEQHAYAREAIDRIKSRTGL